MLWSAPLRLSLLPMPSNVPVGVRLIKGLLEGPHAQALEIWGTLALTTPTRWHVGFLPNSELKNLILCVPKKIMTNKVLTDEVFFYMVRSKDNLFLTLWNFPDRNSFKLGPSWYMHELRTCLLIMLTTALGGAWMLEQPENSVLEYFPPFLTMISNMFKAHGKTSVTNLHW